MKQTGSVMKMANSDRKSVAKNRISLEYNAHPTADSAENAKNVTL